MNIMLDKLTSFELFCGGGGAAIGLTQAGYTSLGAIDFDPEVVDIYNLNHSTKAILQDILLLDKIPKVDLLWMSPPCCSFSGANVGGAESEKDLELIVKIVDLISRNKPLSIVVENVSSYRKSKSYGYLKEYCLLAGYSIVESLEIASNYGAATSRKRFISRMSRNFIKPLEKKASTKWSDFLDLAKEKGMPEQLLTDKQKESLILSKSTDAVIIERCGYRKYPRVIRSNELFPTIRAHSHYCGRGSYRVAYNLIVGSSPPLVVTPYLLSLIQGFPSSYNLGDRCASACKVIGNSVSPPLAKAICESLKSINV